MSYRTQAALAVDEMLLNRVAACAASQNIAQPWRWAMERNWKFSATPGWDASYAYAINAHVSDPGNDEGVITDASILAAVQAVVAAEAAPSP